MKTLIADSESQIRAIFSPIFNSNWHLMQQQNNPQPQQQIITVKWTLAQLDHQVNCQWPFKAKKLSDGAIVNIVDYDISNGAYKDDCGFLHSPFVQDWELASASSNVWDIDGNGQVGYFSNGISHDFQSEINGEFIKEKKCECGAESVGSSGHSNWCPKH